MIVSTANTQTFDYKNYTQYHSNEVLQDVIRDQNHRSSKNPQRKNST